MLAALIFGVVPVGVLIGLLVTTIHEGTVSYDFQTSFLPAARAALHGRSPYLFTTLRTIRGGTAFVYPPLLAYLCAPLALLPHVGADVIAALLCLVSALLALALLDVRDWRCYGAAALWAPVFYTIHLGAISTALALGVAAAWRYRRSPWVAGPIVGLVIAMKLFLWPLLLWLVVSRYWRAAAIAVGSTVAFVLVPWAAAGFAGFRSYARVLRELSAAESHASITIPATVAKFGGSWILGHAIELLVAAALVGGMVLAVRSASERALMSLTLALALVVSPVVWLHYFALLLVVIPLYIRRLHVVWLLPIALFVFPIAPGSESGSELAATLTSVVAISLVAVLVRDGGPRLLAYVATNTVTGSAQQHDDDARKR